MQQGNTTPTTHGRWVQCNDLCSCLHRRHASVITSMAATDAHLKLRKCEVCVSHLHIFFRLFTSLQTDTVEVDGEAVPFEYRKLNCSGPPTGYWGSYTNGGRDGRGGAGALGLS